MNNLPLANKSLGQHWLNDDTALQAIADSASIKKSDTVLEIGPGPGALTKLLIQQAGQVVAVEFDESLAHQLSSQLRADNLKVVSQDILRFDLTSLPSGYKVVANIPYYLTSKLIRVLSESTNPAQTVVLLIQKEVAERVAAKAGDMSLLSVCAQYYWEVELGMVVPAKLFVPAPKVDSRVLIMQRREQPLFPGIDTKLFFQLVKAGFSARRKTVLNSLSGGLRLSKEQTNNFLAAAGVMPSSRAQEMSLGDWNKLYLEISKLPKPNY